MMINGRQGVHRVAGSQCSGHVVGVAVDDVADAAVDECHGAHGARQRRKSNVVLFHFTSSSVRNVSNGQCSVAPQQAREKQEGSRLEWKHNGTRN